MNNIRLHFCDFWSGFNPLDTVLYKELSNRYIIELDNETPDYVIYSCFGHEFLKYDCVRIFHTSENIRPDFNLCDYAIGFDYIIFGDRYLRFPNYALYEEFGSVIKQKKYNLSDLSQKTRFCNFIYSNVGGDPMRQRIFELLSQYKRVDSPGKYLNNMPQLDAGQFVQKVDWQNTKVDFQRNCKFTIAFENSSTPGYTTEKLMHAFVADTIPIYWGNPHVNCEFNSKSFVNCHEFENINKVLERVMELDNNDELYLQMLNEACFPNNRIPDELSRETLMEFYTNILSQSLPLARRRSTFFWTTCYEADLRKGLRLLHIVRTLRRLLRR